MRRRLFCPMPWVADRLFVAGGDFVAENWRQFQREAGLRAVITVAPARPGDFGDPPPWAWLWLAVSEEPDYTLAQLQLGAHFIAAALEAGQPVLLHGALGLHRTRPLVAAYLITQGKSVARVLKEMEQKPWLPPYQGNSTLLEQLAEQGG